jgi:hypothetical protein
MEVEGEEPLIDELIIEPDKVDPSKTTIVCTADQAGK